MKTSPIFLLMCFCVSASAAVIIVEAPSYSEYIEEPYYLPQNYLIEPGTTNLFVTMNGVNKVCFLNLESPLLFEQTSLVNILVGGVKTSWNCFPYKTTVVEVRP